MRVTNTNLFKWTTEIDEEFTTLYFAGASYAELSEHFGVSISAVEKRRMKLGLPSPTSIREGRV